MGKIVVLFLIQLFSIYGNAQEVNLDELIKKAEKSVEFYGEVFKNLSAEEVKTIKYYNSDGTLNETRIVKSFFIVYQSPRNNEVREFRNPIEYNGKNVARSEKKIGRFFEKLARADSDNEEYKKLRQESERYDGKAGFWGITLNQYSPFHDLRKFFEFKVVGREVFDGREAVIIEYKQTQPTLLIKVNPSAEDLKTEPKGAVYSTILSGAFRPTNPRMEGKIWLDAKTGQIWRNEFKVLINPAKLSKPVMTTEILFEYQSSKFGILVPKLYRLVHYEVKGKSDSDLKVRVFVDLRVAYSKFEAMNAEIKNYEVSK